MALMKEECKIEWISYGDDNTRTFFAGAKQRKLASYIYQIKDDKGILLKDLTRGNNDVILQYPIRGAVYHKQTIDIDVMNQGPTLSRDQQVHMCQDFTDMDIKTALYSIPDIKSPGPDGFNSGFFKHTWHKLGTLICSVVKEFFTTGTMPSYLSETKLVLIPKVTHPQNASEFRPISCCNVKYKFISKLLCKRLKEVLPSLIDQSQGAFVKGRELLYNVLICHDLVRGYQRKNISPRCLLKIDLQKAFDSIHWDFLKECLSALKFPEIFIKWVLNCVTSVNFTISLNGQDSVQFKGGKGLRQGDPLFPLLFVISMEYLSRLLKITSKQVGFKFHPHCSKLGLTHLMFADDLLLFCKAHPTTLQILNDALSSFKETAGLMTNLQKSQIVLGGYKESLQQQCLQVTGLKGTSFPLKYLGVPITASRLTKIKCTSLVEKIMAKVQISTTRNISCAGRARLINSVIFGMYTYWASIFLLPTEVTDKITGICRNYL
ncbi:LOW QUALITY PROTEIN: hypothetical protein Cgig2_026410 [Carnegiea gigantea]|uniref:Reverse transcriptase domain-containing protein n=1 Tax=Carnegiea gigantea TaxID=171969 RepID=A0A9Q1K2N2_9CARY|nr:LOW QUALITY PROTEIN: hypothetical protein Cgig2_026410 [Carnegiea gigantea]